MTNDECLKYNEARRTKRTGKPLYDLEEWTARFGEAIIAFAKKIPPNPINDPLIRQVVKDGTRPGANYCEADDAVSKWEFLNKISTCKKESRETKYWLRMVASAEPSLKEEARVHGRKPRNRVCSSRPSCGKGNLGHLDFGHSFVIGHWSFVI